MHFWFTDPRFKRERHNERLGVKIFDFTPFLGERSIG